MKLLFTDSYDFLDYKPFVAFLVIERQERNVHEMSTILVVQLEIPLKYLYDDVISHTAKVPHSVRIATGSDRFCRIRIRTWKRTRIRA